MLNWVEHDFFFINLGSGLFTIILETKWVMKYIKGAKNCKIVFSQIILLIWVTLFA